jgi:2-oxoglutarate dehydrogenase E2 component (dihydrolipoamide succinyltransferase)
MSNIEMIMPKMGESVAEATIIKWLKKEGDKVEADESVLEIATDKVDSEVPSPVSGKILKLLFKEGDVVQVGKVICLIGNENESVVDSLQAIVNSPKVETPKPLDASANQNIGKPVNQPIVASSNRFYSPLVRNIAQKEGIAQSELDAILGTGKESRVTKNDILAYLPNRVKFNTPTETAKIKEEPNVVASRQQTVSIPAPQKPAVSINAGDEIIEMDRMRKLIAEHMVMSKHTSPHVTSYVEADVTNIVMWRNKWKDQFEKREGEKLTFTPIFIEAVAKAIKDFPMVNISVNGTQIIVKKNINIGMATALPSGNLIVPVIKNADRMNLYGLAKTVNDLASRARNNKLLPDEIQGGTYTLTNVGTFGNVMGTPIINQPQVAIMAVGAIRKKPAVIETEFGDTIGIRHMMFLSHAYDHRVVDGALGGSFVRKVADYLEQFDINLTI